MKFSYATSRAILQCQRKRKKLSFNCDCRQITYCSSENLIYMKQIPLNLIVRNSNKYIGILSNFGNFASVHPRIISSIVYPTSQYSYHTVFVSQRHIHLSILQFEKEQGNPSKPSSQVEVTVQDLEEKSKAATTSSVGSDIQKQQVEPKKSLGIRIKEEILHYYSGFKLLFIDVKICSKYVWRILNGDLLSRREHRQLIRTTGDLFRLLPFSVFIIVPFMEFLLPVAIKLFPGMLPSTFETINEKEAKIKKMLKVKLEMAKFLQKTLDSMAVEAKGHKSESAKEFVQFFEKIQKTGEAASTAEILKFSKLFKDEITLDSLSRPQLIALCRLLEMQPFGTNNFLRFQLRMKLRSLAADDKIIQHEGIDSLAVWELQQACRTRGMRAYGLPKERLQIQLQQWLDLSLNERVPPSLLLLSRTLYLPDKVLPGDALAATISTLPEEIATRTKASIGKTEGKIDNVTRLEIIKSEEVKIKEDKLEKITHLEEKKKLEDKKKVEVKMKPVEIATEKVIEMDILEAAADKISVSEKPDVHQVIKEEKAPTELTAEDIDNVEEALEMMELEKRRAFIEEQELSELKSELADYEEDIQDFKLALKKAGLDEKSIQESKAARRLFSKVNQMINKIDPIVNALNKERENLQRKIEKDASKENEQGQNKTELINLEELTKHLKRIVDTSDAAKVEKIHSVLAKMDDDMDGAIKADDVLKVIELLSEDRENLSTELFEEVVEMMVKEEQMEAQALIKKALQLPSIRMPIKNSIMKT